MFKQGNACRDTAQNILPASHNLQGSDCLDHMGCVCVYQPFTDFSDENEMHEDLYHPPIPVAGAHGANRLLKNHLGLCPETSYPLLSLMLALEGVVKTLSCSLWPQHLEIAFLFALSPLFQLEELYCLFLVGKKK